MTPITGGWDISFRAIFKILAALALSLLLVKIFTISLLILLGLFLAVSLDPTVRRLQSLGVRRGFAVGTVGLLMAGAVAAFSFFIVPSIFGQVTVLIQAVPAFKNSMLSHLAGDSGFQSLMRDILESPKLPSTEVLMDRTINLLTFVGEGLSEIFLVLIFSIYLLVDGRRAFQWISDFFSAPVRIKLVATGKEASLVVHGYVAAQILTSLGSALFVYLLLAILKVPGALTLGVVAGIMDVIPLLGFFLALIPAVLLGLSVSTLTGVIILISYTIYHLAETYLIAPLIYGRRMNVSSLVVLIALLVAGTTGGILAALAILPIVASYPIIERIWLVKYLGRQVVSKHSDGMTSTPVAPQVTMWSEKLLKLTGASSGMANREMLNLGKKVLVIEDDADVRAMLKEILETEGYVTFAAANGKDGFSILHRHADIGLVLLDMMMPVMDGRSFLDTLKNDPFFKHIPVVFLSGTVDQGNTQGAVGVLRKPAELEAVLETVEKYYSQSV